MMACSPTLLREVGPYCQNRWTVRLLDLGNLKQDATDKLLPPLTHRESSLTFQAIMRLKPSIVFPRVAASLSDDTARLALGHFSLSAVGRLLG